jgi:hypothetical protein
MAEQKEWKPIATAPRDGTEILAWRQDAGVMLVRYTSLEAFLTESELEDYDEETIFQEDWFYADFVQGGRLDEEPPTHWMHLPADPEED